MAYIRPGTALQAQRATVEGSVKLTINGAGALQAQSASVSAVGNREVSGPGSLQAQAAAAAGAGVIANPGAFAQGIQFLENAASSYDYGQELNIPSVFGTGEFTHKVVITPDNTYPFGTTQSGSNQLLNWATEDVARYTDPGGGDLWWFDGNFLLDGHNNNNVSNGTHSLQIYGGGRVRWLFGDGAAAAAREGGLHGIQPTPTSGGIIVVDGATHVIHMVRRDLGGGVIELALYVDGVLQDTQTTTSLVNMQQAYWTAAGWPGYPGDENGWFWGAEKQAALNKIPQYADYKGILVEEVFYGGALTPAEIAADQGPVNTLAADYLDHRPFDEGTGFVADTANGLTMSLFNSPDSFWPADAADLDWQATIAEPSVVAYSRFDTPAEVQAHLFNQSSPTVFHDTSVRMAGSAGSMRMEIPTTMGVSSQNDWTPNVGQVDGNGKFTDLTGPGAAVPNPAPGFGLEGAPGDLGNKFFVRWQQRFDDAMLDNQWVQEPDFSGGWKQIIVNHGDRFGWYRGVSGIPEATSSQNFMNLVVQNIESAMMPMAYHGQGRVNFVEGFNTSADSFQDNTSPVGIRTFSGYASDEVVQNALDDGNANPLLRHPTRGSYRENSRGCASSFGCYFGTWQLRYTSNPPPAAVNARRYHPNENMHFQMGVELGTYSTSLPPQPGVGTTSGWEDCRFRLWVGREGERSYKVIDFITDIWENADYEAAFGKIHLTTFHTDLVANAINRVLARTWYGSVIVATELVNDPMTSMEPMETMAYASAMPANEWRIMSNANGFNNDMQITEIISPNPGGANPWSPTTILDAWHSGCWDRKRRRMMSIAGGGDSAHGGNGVYVWDRLTSNSPRCIELVPSSVHGAGVTNSDGTLGTHHSYGMHVYDRFTDKVYIMGVGATTVTGGGAFASDVICSFDCATDSWDFGGGSSVLGVYPTLSDIAGFSIGGSNIIGSCAAIDKITGQIYWHSSRSGNSIVRFDPRNASNNARFAAASAGVHCHMVIDPDQRFILQGGGGLSTPFQHVFYDLDNLSAGGTFITNVVDAVDGNFSDSSFWKNGQAAIQDHCGLHYSNGILYAMDQDANFWYCPVPIGLDKGNPNASVWVWTRLGEAGTRPDMPPSFQGRGIYNRFADMELDQITDGRVFFAAGRSGADPGLIKVSV